MAHPSTKLLATALLLALQACTSVAKSSAEDTALTPSGGAPAGAAVVSQIGAKDPLLSPHKRQYWLDQRQAKALAPRMRGALATGEAAAAITMAKAKLAQTPGDISALTTLAAALTMTHNFELAAYYASLLERVQPGSAFAFNIKGLAAMLAPRTTIADYRVAMEYFQKAMDADPTQIAAGLNLGSLQLELGNAVGAASVFQTVADRCGQCATGLMGYGRSLARSEQYAAAVKVFKQILDRQPRHAGALYNLALVYKNGYNDKAQAEKYLYALIKDDQIRDNTLKDRAQIVLRTLEGQKGLAERRAKDDDDTPTPAAANPDDAEILMSGSGAPDEEP